MSKWFRECLIPRTDAEMVELAIINKARQPDADQRDLLIEDLHRYALYETPELMHDHKWPKFSDLDLIAQILIQRGWRRVAEGESR